jgi:RNA polymerase II subunit A-like phosphatase
MVAANSLALEAQLEERPLARKQEALLDDSAEVSEKANEKPLQVKKALLKNDDAELQRVSKVGFGATFTSRIC